MVPVGVPSFVRLKIVESGCHCGWKQTEPVSIGGIIEFERREANVALLPLREHTRSVEMSQAPCQLIERGSKTANEVPEQHREWFRGLLHPNSPNLQCLIEICFIGDGIGWKFKPIFQLYFKSIEVFLRPAGLHFRKG